jgi:hypothetical protein
MTSMRQSAMPIGMGILCDGCKRVHFISPSRKSGHVLYDRARKEFRLTCLPSCGRVTFFNSGMLKPYSVSAEALGRGCADVAECRQMAEIEQQPASASQKS